MTSSPHAYAVRPRKDHRGVDLISDALPFDRLWYGEPNAVSNTVDYAKFYSRSRDAVIRVYDEARNIVGTHEQPGGAISREPASIRPGGRHRRRPVGNIVGSRKN